MAIHYNVYANPLKEVNPLIQCTWTDDLRSMARTSGNVNVFVCHITGDSGTLNPSGGANLESIQLISDALEGHNEAPLTTITQLLLNVPTVDRVRGTSFNINDGGYDKTFGELLGVADNDLNNNTSVIVMQYRGHYDILHPSATDSNDPLDWGIVNTKEGNGILMYGYSSFNLNDKAYPNTVRETLNYYTMQAPDYQKFKYAYFRAQVGTQYDSYYLAWAIPTADKTDFNFTAYGVSSDNSEHTVTKTQTVNQNNVWFQKNIDGVPWTFYRTIAGIPTGSTDLGDYAYFGQLANVPPSSYVDMWSAQVSEITVPYLGLVEGDIQDFIVANIDKFGEPETETIYYGDFCYYAFSYLYLDAGGSGWDGEWIPIWGKNTNITLDTINLSTGTKPTTPDYDPTYPPSDNTDPDDTPTQLNGLLGGLNKAYALTESESESLGKYIWGGDFDPLGINSSPIESLISLLKLPCYPPAKSEKVRIVLGGKKTDILAPYLANTVVRHKNPFGIVTLRRQFNNFFDFEPYTEVKLYLPYVGFVQLVPSQIIDHSIRLDLIVDYLTGNMRYLLAVSNSMINDDGSIPQGTQFQYVTAFEGNCGTNIPVTQTNAAQIKEAFIGAIANVGLAAATGQETQAISAGVSAAETVMSLTLHQQTAGSISPTTALVMTQMPYFIISYPKFTIPAKYANQHGFRCDKTLRLNSLKGFTVCDDIVMDGLTCTDEECKIIEQGLKEGVYL